MKRSRSGNQKKGNDWDNIDDDGPTVVGGGAGSREEDDEESNNKQPPPSLPSQEERQGGRPKKMARGMDLEFEKPKPNFLRMLRGGQSNPEQDKQLQQQLERTKGPRSTAEPKVKKIEEKKKKTLIIIFLFECRYGKLLMKMKHCILMKNQ